MITYALIVFLGFVVSIYKIITGTKAIGDDIEMIDEFGRLERRNGIILLLAVFISFAPIPYYFGVKRGLEIHTESSAMRTADEISESDSVPKISFKKSLDLFYE